MYKYLICDKEPRPSNVKTKASWTYSVGKLNSHMQKKERKIKVIWSLTPYIKNNSECIKELDIIPQTIRYIEENLSVILQNLNIRDAFRDVTSLARETKVKINGITSN